MTYYGIEYPYGVCDVYRIQKFFSKEQRDEWVDNGPAERSARGFREKIKAHDNRVRKHLRDRRIYA